MQRRELFQEVRLTETLPLESLRDEADFAEVVPHGVAIAQNGPSSAGLVAPPTRRMPPASTDRPETAKPDTDGAKDKRIAGYQVALRGNPPGEGRGNALADRTARRFRIAPGKPAAGAVGAAADAKSRTGSEPADAPRLLARPMAAENLEADTIDDQRERRLVRVLFVLRTGAATDRR
jgi:hypothetical protein